MRPRRYRPLPRSFVPQSPEVVLITLKKFIWVMVAALFMTVGALVYASGFFTIKHIYCSQEGEPCPLSIAAELANHQHKNILTFRAAEVEAKLLAASPGIQHITITVSLPDTIRVNLTGRTPNLTAAVSTSSTQLVFIDNRNVPFQVEEHSPLRPEIVGPKMSELKLGETIEDKNILSAIELAHTLNDYFIKYEYVKVWPDRLQVVLKNAPEAIFPLEGDYSLLVPSLQLILRQTTIELGEPRLIDLRFSKPILRM